MASSKNMTYKYVVATGIVALVAGVCAMADSPSSSSPDEILWQMQNKDLHTYIKVAGLQQWLVAVLNLDVLAKVSAPDTKSQVTKLSNWPGSPALVVASAAGGMLHMRVEKDFLIIWHRRDVALAMDREPRAVIVDATKEILQKAYCIELDDSVDPHHADKKRGFRISQDAKVIEGTGAITCSYSLNLRPLEAADQVWVLVKDKNVVIVLRKLAARSCPIKCAYDGLMAAKIEPAKEKNIFGKDESPLTKEELKQLGKQPVLAQNVIFDKKADLSKLPNELLNGCMWPIDDENATGIKNICSAIVLSPPHLPTSIPPASKSVPEQTKPPRVESPVP